MSEPLTEAELEALAYREYAAIHGRERAEELRASLAAGPPEARQRLFGLLLTSLGLDQNEWE